MKKTRACLKQKKQANEKHLDDGSLPETQMHVKERPELVNSILSSLKAQGPCKSRDSNPVVLSAEGIQSKQGDTCSTRD